MFPAVPVLRTRIANSTRLPSFAAAGPCPESCRSGCSGGGGGGGGGDGGGGGGGGGTEEPQSGRLPSVTCVGVPPSESTISTPESFTSAICVPSGDEEGCEPAVRTRSSDPSAADTAAGFHYAFGYSMTDLSPLSGATYANSGTATSASAPGLGAGTYYVFARVIDRDGGYTEYSAQVTVNPRPISVAADAGQGKTYGGADPTAFTLVMNASCDPPP